MELIQNALSELIESSKENNLIYKPSFFRLTDSEDRNKLDELLKQPGIQVSDELHGQIMELVKSRNPSHRYPLAELEKAAHEYLNGTPSDEYGVWVYYSWLNKLVHILEKEEYIDLRTNRNLFKITPEERDILSTKIIGVLGLSVGQAVAISLAMERGFGELRIADFDILELSNLNRIRSGLQDLGLLKTVSTARQIAELDPYLKVVCFHDGLTEENIDTFFTEGGKLDILIDECDGLDIKIIARHKAKEYGVPVVMETSDRGMIDVERFDIEPNRPILHGLIDHLDINPQNLKGLSNEEKVPYILPMIGIDTMSDRIKASVLEVEQTITTWPQLASDVILGGATAANVCRRIALGQFETSGRFFVDLNKIISEENAHQFISDDDNQEKEEIDERLEELVLKAMPSSKNQIELNKEQIKTLVEAAIWAPSGGNSQPWQWVYENKNLYLFLDKSRASSFLDFASAGSYLSLGAATENLILKAHNMGLEINVDKFPEKDNNKLAAVFRFFNSPEAADKTEDHSNDHLHDAIRIRLTNRLLRPRQIIDNTHFEQIKELGQTTPGAQIKFIDEDKTMSALGELISKADRILITHKEGHHGFVNEIRWNEEEVNRTRDGVDIATVDLSAGEAAGFRMSKNWSVVSTLNKWGGGSVFEKLSRKGVLGASAIGLITMPSPNTQHYYDAGISLEKIWLYNNKQGISLQPMTPLTYMLNRLIKGKGVGLSPANIEELTEIKEMFYTIFKLNPDEHPAFMFRLLKAEEPKVKSLRRPIEDVLIIK